MESIKKIREQILFDLKKIFSSIREQSEENYYLLLANAEDTSNNCYYDIGLVLDSNLDNLVDQTRLNYCMQYMDWAYRRDNNDYSGDDGMFRLNIELQIYMQTWESTAFLKKLNRLVCAFEQNTYLWKTNIPEVGKWEFIKNEIWQPLIDKNLSLGTLIKEAYSSHLRNAIAHSKYYIVDTTREIILYDKESIKEEDRRILSINCFQKKFLYSVNLTYELLNLWNKLREEYAKLINGKPLKISLPTGRKTPATAKYIGDGNYRFCAYV